MIRTFYALIIMAALCMVVSFASCGNKGDSQTDSIQGIPDDLRETLVQNCDYVDIIFFNTPASMSQTDASSIQKALAFIAKEPAVLDEGCNAIGRISYISSGEITAEGDIYLDQGCAYIVFMKDNKPAYANRLSAEGVQFFQGVFQQINSQFEGQ